MLQVRYTSFWKGRSGLEQVLLVAVGLLLVLSCCCVLALALAQQPHCTNTNIRMLHPDHPAHCGGGDTSSPAPSPAPAPAPAPVCLETECVTVAAGIIQAADFSADPCEDFYQVAIHLHLSTLSKYLLCPPPVRVRGLDGRQPHPGRQVQLEHLQETLAE